MNNLPPEVLILGALALIITIAWLVGIVCFAKDSLKAKRVLKNTSQIDKDLDTRATHNRKLNILAFITWLLTTVCIICYVAH